MIFSTGRENNINININIKLGLDFDPELQFLYMNDRDYLGYQ